MRRPAPGLDLLVDREGQDIACGVVGTGVRLAVAVQKFLAIAVEQASAQLDARRFPRRGIETDHARGEMPVRIKLEELDVDQTGSAAKRKADAFPGQIVGR